MLFIVSFLFVGALSGATIAYAMGMRSPKQLAQGALGGLISGLLMALLLPK
jgi:uncharacterized membrane protein